MYCRTPVPDAFPPEDIAESGPDALDDFSVRWVGPEIPGVTLALKLTAFSGSGFKRFSSFPELASR